MRKKSGAFMTITKTVVATVIAMVTTRIRIKIKIMTTMGCTGGTLLRIMVDRQTNLIGKEAVGFRELDEAGTVREGWIEGTGEGEEGKNMILKK